MIPDKAIKEREERDRVIKGCNISEESRKDIKDIIEQLDEPESSGIREIIYILTGDDRFEK